MKSSSTKLIPLIIFVTFIISGCGVNKNDNANISAANNQAVENDNKNIPKDDVEGLERIVKLPIQPEEATWREDNSDNQSGNNNLSAPPGGKLTAVLKFSAEDAQKLVEQIDKSQPPTAAEVDAESWFPPELIAKSQESGDESLKGTAFSVSDFLQEPYKNGKMIRINETDYFVLELTSF